MSMDRLSGLIYVRLNNWAENALNPQAAAGALHAVLNLHQRADDGTDDTERRYYRCSTCGPHWPCATVKAIATELGIEDGR